MDSMTFSQTQHTEERSIYGVLLEKLEKLKKVVLLRAPRKS
jgi:hypothetical protein